jgi:hypothetical protein
MCHIPPSFLLVTKGLDWNDLATAFESKLSDRGSSGLLAAATELRVLRDQRPDWQSSSDSSKGREHLRDRTSAGSG